MSDICFAYVTAPNHTEAKALSLSLLEKKLAACVNILPGMTSLYLWEEKVREDNEVVMIIKTRSALFEEVVSFIKDNHSYTVPCVLKIDISAGSADYLTWLIEQC